MYARLKRHERMQERKMYDLAKMLCTFINAPMAKELFTEPESVENTGFLEDLKKMDPNFDTSKYEEYLEDTAG